MNDAKYIGLDVHQATITVAVRDSAGKLVIEAIVETKAETILQFLRGVYASIIQAHQGPHTGLNYTRKARLSAVVFD